MSYKPIRNRDSIIESAPDINEWPLADTSLLKEECKVTYKIREAIVRSYFDKTPLLQICETYLISRQYIHKLVKKCLVVHPDGRIWGFRALINYMHQKKYDRIAEIMRKDPYQQGGASGALVKLFEQHTDIKDEIEGYFLKKHNIKVIHESKITYKSTFKHFIDACRLKGIKLTMYPFNVKWMGYRSLIKYLNDLIITRYADFISSRSGTKALKKHIVGSGDSISLVIDRPYMRVQFDGHNIDISFVMQIESIHGGYTDVVVHRLWLLLIIEHLTGAVLGYHVCYGKEYNQRDVIKCVKKTIVPWVPKDLGVPGLKYDEKGGMPSAVFKKLEWAIFQELLYDSAKANIANESKRVISDVTGCSVNVGPLAFPDRRALIERFFGIFEECGFHRLPSTLGNGPQDPRRHNPDKMAEKYKIRLEHIEDLIEVLISNYNGTPNVHNGYRSPLEQLGMFITNQYEIIPKLEESKRYKLHLFDTMFVRVVRGSIKTGKRPYVQLEGAIYTSNILSSMPQLISQKLTLYVDDDARTCLAFFSNGMELGILRTKGIWSRSPHTLEMRRAIIRASHKRLIHYSENDDPVHIYYDFLRRESLTNKRLRKRCVKVSKFNETNKSHQDKHQQVHQKREGVKTNIDPGMYNQKTFNN